MHRINHIHNSMSCFLFNEIVFGPVLSRRLGISLGINLLPVNKKLCTFDCIYCECGWSIKPIENHMNFHLLEDVKSALELKLKTMHSEGQELDNITYAGNGEPTLHPDFKSIMLHLVMLRKKYYPKAHISVLTNGSTLSNISVIEALNMAEFPIIKLDTGSEELFRAINQPLVNIKRADIVELAKDAHISNKVIQTLFLRGTYAGKNIDNTNSKEVESWLRDIEYIKPHSVMIYSIARKTPAKDLFKVDTEELEAIADKVRALGIPTNTY